MKKTSNSSVAGKGDVLRMIAQAVAPYVADKRQTHPPPTPAYYHQDDSPIGRRRFLQLVRKGTLQGRKVGRRVLVLCDEVHAFIESHPTVATSPTTDGDALDDWGLRRRGKP
jgi:hypothetical protein